MPKIDWFDNYDDQPHWEPRPRRDRSRDRRARLEQIIAMSALPPVVQEPAARRPLHLIWGAPTRRAPGEAGNTT